MTAASQLQPTLSCRVGRVVFATMPDLKTRTNREAVYSRPTDPAATWDADISLTQWVKGKGLELCNYRVAVEWAAGDSFGTVWQNADKPDELFDVMVRADGRGRCLCEAGRSGKPCKHLDAKRALLANGAFQPDCCQSAPLYLSDDEAVAVAFAVEAVDLWDYPATDDVFSDHTPVMS